MRVITNKIRKTHSSRLTKGESNGYLIVDDPNHPWYAMPFEDIPVKVHGGIAYSDTITAKNVEFMEELKEDDIGSRVVGFDTGHIGDTPERWSDANVRKHAEKYLLKPALKCMNGHQSIVAITTTDTPINKGFLNNYPGLTKNTQEQKLTLELINNLIYRLSSLSSLITSLKTTKTKKRNVE